MSKNIKSEEKNHSETAQISKKSGGLVHNQQNNPNSGNGAVIGLIFGSLILVLLVVALIGINGDNMGAVELNQQSSEKCVTGEGEVIYLFGNEQCSDHQLKNFAGGD